MGTTTLDKKIFALPARRRASLASRLLASLDSSLSQPHAQAWNAEIEARMEAHDAGRIRAVPAAKVLSYRGKLRQ